MKHLTTLLALPLLLICQPALPAQGEKEAIKAFKREFKPKVKPLEDALQGTESFNSDSRQYQDALDERADIAAKWTAAVQRLRGYGSPAVAKVVAGAWPKVDKVVKPLLAERAKAEKRVDREYQKVMKLSGGKGFLPGEPVPKNAQSAVHKWLMQSRRSSEIRRNITDLATLQDELRLVVSKMRDAAGLTWMLNNVVGSKKHGLVLKVEAIRSAAQLGERMLQEMTAALDKAKKSDELAALIFGIGILGEKAKASAPKLIELMSHGDAGVREQAALALKHMKAPGSIGPMIQLLATTNGHARKRIATVLEILTGQQHGINIGAWQSWFAAEGADYAAGKVPLGNGKASQHEEYNKKNYYYGIPQDGGSIVYIIDCSGSMVVDKDNPEWRPSDRPNHPFPIPAKDGGTSRSKATKDELIRALGVLSSDKKFNIVWYSHAATLYKKKMVQATPEKVRLAQEWVKGLPADSSTNIYDAVKMAFTLTGRGSFDKSYGVEFDTIFLMTDGKPTLQGVGDDDPMKIVEGARKWNSLKRVMIHTIAFGTKDIDHKFMHMLADENGGQYRIVLPDGVKKYEDIKDKLPRNR